MAVNLPLCFYDQLQFGSRNGSMTENGPGDVSEQDQTIRLQSLEPLNTAAPKIGLFIPIGVLAFPTGVIFAAIPMRLQLTDFPI